MSRTHLSNGKQHNVNGKQQDNINGKQQCHEGKRIPFPYEIRDVEPDLNLQLCKDFSKDTGFVQVGQKKWFFPIEYVKEAENFYNFELREDDVFVVTFPRSGTTWTQEIVWLLCNDLNYQRAAEIPLTKRFPFLEFACFFKSVEGSSQSLDENRTGRRFIKTHFPFSLLPPNLTQIGCKVLYVARNPKDVAVSYYHLNSTMRQNSYKGDFRKYWDYFEQNLRPWMPYWEHIKEGWNRRHEENVHFIFYENMNKNLRSSLEDIATFLGKSYSQEQLDELEAHVNINNLKKIKSVNKVDGYIREGKTGGWKDYFDEELEKRADQWIENNLKNTDLVFPL